jgi:hypothetical protein
MQLLQPATVVLIIFPAARHVFGVGRIDQADLEASGFQQVIHHHPIHTGRLHGHCDRTVGHEVGDELPHLVGGAAELAHFDRVFHFDGHEMGGGPGQIDAGGMAMYDGQVFDALIPLGKARSGFGGTAGRGRAGFGSHQGHSCGERWRIRGRRRARHVVLSTGVRPGSSTGRLTKCHHTAASHHAAHGLNGTK